MADHLPTLRQLQFFDSLTRNGSFSRAAEECAVSQSTLSAGIKELETILDAALVDRTSRQFVLTAVGEIVARQASELLGQARDLVRLASMQPPLTGDLRLGLIPTIGPFLLPRVVEPISKAFPSLRLFLREALTEDLVASLRAGQIDMAILAMPIESEGLDTLIFAEDPFYFACRPDHPLADKSALDVDALAGEQLLLLEDGHCLRDHALSACRLQSRDVARAFGGTSLLTLAQMVRSGVGTTLLPALAIDEGLADATDLRVLPLQDGQHTPSRDLGIAWRRGAGREEEARALADVLAPYARSSLHD